jgi:hypothetical protein
MDTTILQVAEYLHQMGGFHDSRVDGIAWLPGKGRLEVSTTDLQANFSGLPEYTGPAPGRLVFVGVKDLKLDVDASSGPLRIYDAIAHTVSGVNEVELRFSPAGVLNVIFATLSVEPS